jgi:hypothetical protein
MMPFKLILRVILWVVWLSAAYCFGQSKPTKNEVINSCAEVGENNTRGYLGSDIYPLATQNWSAQQLAKFRISIDGDDLGLSAWILSMSKYQKIRKAALLIQQYSMSEILKKFNPEAQSDNYQSLNFWIQEFKNFASQSTYLPVTQNFVREKLFQINQNIDFHKQLKLLKFAAPILCPKISCIRGLKDIINFTSPKNFIIDDSSTVISFTKIWQEVLTDARYQVALAKLSLTMSHKIQQLESNHLTPFENHNIYDDTIKAFSELGLTSKEVQNMTYNILGLYGSRGASVDFLRHFINQENYPTAIMLQFIFTAISYLDSFKSLNLQTLYSLPQEIKTSCDFGKPYHFWMSAYLSFKLKRKTLKKSSLYGAHLMVIFMKQLILKRLEEIIFLFHS